MTVRLNDRTDFTLDNARRVAFEGEDVEFTRAALDRMARAHETFQQYVDASRDIFIYGVTSLGGPEAKTHRTPEETMQLRRRMMRNRRTLAFSPGGEELPEEGLRATVFATLAQFIEGNTATHPRRAQAVADLLKRPMPSVPAQGVTVAGEILAMGFLYGEVPQIEEAGHQAGSGNGNQFTTGLSAGGAVQARRRLELAVRVFCLSVEAIDAPLEAYDPAFKKLWGDRFEGEALDAMNGLLRGARSAKRREYQAPVSWRVLPRVLGQAYRAVATLEEVAETSLRSISSNPGYSLPDRKHPFGHTFSNGGYHNAICPPALDSVAATWVDLGEVAHRHATKLHKGEVSHLPDRLFDPSADEVTRTSTSYLEYVPNGFLEEMRLLAQPSLLSAAEPAASEQDDQLAPGFLAFTKQRRVAELFDGIMAVLATAASQALYVTRRAPAAPLRLFLAAVRAHVPPVTEARPLGADVQALAEALGEATSTGDFSLGTKRRGAGRVAAR
jgi:histidine ammonia-lyase